MSDNLTGKYLIKVYGPAHMSARKLWPRVKNRSRIRRHALKLRFWPEKRPEDDQGEVLDLDWSWIKAMPGKNVGELRIEETIGGFNNIRIIFFVADKRGQDPLPMIWVLAVLQKKRQEFTRNQVDIFTAQRRQVLERVYGY